MTDNPPPAYVTSVQRVTSSGRHLRSLLIALTLLAIAVTAAIGGLAFRDAFDGGEGNGVDGQLLAVYMVQVALMWTVMVIAIAGVILAWKTSLKAARAYLILTIIASIITFSATICRFAMHFRYKRNIVSACRVQTMDENLAYNRGRDYDYTDLYTQAGRECADEWNRTIGYNVAYIIVAMILCACIVLVARVRYWSIASAEKNNEQVPLENVKQSNADHQGVNAQPPQYAHNPSYKQ